MHTNYYVMTQNPLQQPKCNFCSPGPHCGLFSCAPTSTNMLVRAKVPWKENYSVALVQCAVFPQLCCQHQMCSSHEQFLRKVPSIHPQEGREENRLILLPHPALDAWQQLSVAKWAVKGFVVGCLSSSNLPFQRLIIAKVPFWGWFWFRFFFWGGGRVISE